MEPEIEQFHFRQTNLKRMMKLAAVKSGQANSGISLTQLDQLPLEIKLQVVNEDSHPLGQLSQVPPPQNKATRPAMVLQKLSRQDYPPILHPQSSKATNRAREPLPYTGEAISLLTQDQSDVIAQGDEQPCIPMEVDMFQEDIQPLQTFLDNHLPTDKEAINMIATFLRTCLKEKRTDVLVTLIRSIRKRTDGWSAREVLFWIVHSVDDDHTSIYGFHLDVDWLLR